MKKNKFQKGKTLAIGVFGLAAVAVMGVGFSSWVISFRQQDAISNVNLKVAQTEDASIFISHAKLVRAKESGDTGNAVGTFNSVEYVALEAGKGFAFDSTSRNEGIVQSKGTLESRETLYAYFEVQLGKDVESTATISAQLTAAAASTDEADVKAKAAYDAAIGAKNYLVKSGLEASTATTIFSINSSHELVATNAAIAGTTISVVDKTASGAEGKVYDVLMSFGFSWGAAFNGLNPTDYFTRETTEQNHDESGDALAKDYSHISTALTELSSIGDGHVKFTLNIVPSARS